MAGFVLKDESSNSDEAMAIGVEPDFDFEILAVDPYSDSKWFGENLDQWSVGIEHEFKKCVETIEESVLKEIRKEKIEQWMVPILEKRKNVSETFVVLKQLLEMIQRAKKDNKVILFYGD